MKIVIINGSARRGNTLTAIDAFVKGASEKNEIEIIQPDRLHIAPCKGCGACQCYKGCIDQDDTNPTIDKITAADCDSFLLLRYIEYSYAAEPPVQFRLSHLSRRSEPL